MNEKKKLYDFIATSAIVLYTLFCSIRVAFAMLFSGGQKVFSFHVRRWAKQTVKISSCSISNLGLEKLNPLKTYVYVANHTSLWDIPVLFAVLTDYPRIMYKQELEKIPFFGGALKRSPFIAVKRTNPREAMTSLDEAYSAIRENISVFMFPEGTRSIDGKLGRFKRGAFALAARGGKEIVPVSISGSSDVLPNGSMLVRTGRVINVKISEPLPTVDNPTRLQEKQLMDSVYTVIESNLN